MAWYPARTIEVLRYIRGDWVVIRGLPFDNAGALGVLEADGLISCVDAAQEQEIRGALALVSLLTGAPRREREA